MEVTSKRTPSRCREWERQRRNKFNDAISKLGEIVKSINRENDCSGKDAENVQYPKIEIIQKAILCLTNCAQEKTQLRAEILALQVKIDAEKSQKCDKKDASTQVYIGLNKKDKNGKYMKLLMLQKSKRSVLKEKINLDPKTKTVNPEKSETETAQIPPKPKLPKLLPRYNLMSKKGTENTIVVLPATPYLFPQRPLLFPSVPPAIVLLDPNLQTINKTSVPIVSRNSGDVTKTTMVNILPISAYSRPLSASKTKKVNLKGKGEINKKFTKKSKPVVKTTKESVNSNDNLKTKILTSNENKCKIDSNDNECITDKIEQKHNNEDSPPHEKSELTVKPITTTKENDNTLSNQSTINVKKLQNQNDIDENKKVPDILEKPKSTETINIVEVKLSSAPTSSVSVKHFENKTSEDTNNVSKAHLKETVTEEKENKLPNLLETTMCDNVVDGGNARLELAEEFLAASPTAAFLMSFPLVSGNRADSPAEEPHTTLQVNAKDNTQRRVESTSEPVTYFEKPHHNDIKTKAAIKYHAPTLDSKHNEQQKFGINMVKQIETKISNSAPISNIPNENPFLNLSMPSLIPTSCTLSDTSFGLDFDCNINKPIQSQPSSYMNNNNFFYKSDPFSTVKNAIYSTSSITSSHEYNGLGLYPCAMEKYSSKNKSDFSNVDDNLMKIGSSRLTYDIDLGWSHKGLDFVSCTSGSSSFNKDSILNTNTSTTYSTSYNPFNPEFHVPLVSNTNKKDIATSNKPTSTFADTITSFYSQPANLWSEEIPFPINNNISKPLTSKHQNYPTLDHGHSNVNVKSTNAKSYESKQITEASIARSLKPVSGMGQTSEKFTKKSPSKMHINWMTSEIRPMQSNYNVHSEIKEPHKLSYNHLDPLTKKQDTNDSNYFSLPMHNFGTQTVQEDFQVWPSTRPLGTTEISIEPPPINLPTLVGDLALGPHDRKKNIDISNRILPQPDIQNCGNFLSVTQLMNRSTDNMTSRYQAPNIEPPKSITTKQNITHITNDSNSKVMTSRLESHIPQPCYVFNDKIINSYENMPQFSQTKSKSNSKSDKVSKPHKNNYSAESLIRGGSCSQKSQESSVKFMMLPQKYNDFTVQDSSIAQVSHFPPVLDYSDNGYSSQQFSGTTLYNTTTNTISNSFYSNLMPGSSNLMSSNYTNAPFTSDFIDYNQTTECNYTNHKYDDFKMRNNSTVFQSDKVPTNYKSSRRESSTKHKLECSKKEPSKKYHTKRLKLNNDVEEWSDPSHLLWQNKSSSKRHANLMSDDLPFPNYVGNQMPTQYQPDFFNSHLMPSNMQSMGHNVDRSVTSFPVTSRANFNLSTIFPEITMKVQ